MVMVARKTRTVVVKMMMMIDDDLDEDINAHDGGSRADMTRGLAKFLSISNKNHFS